MMLQDRLQPHLSPGATFELGPQGFCAHRRGLAPEGYRLVERALSTHPVCIFDFNIEPELDLAENIHNGERFQPLYAGVPGEHGAPLFRVDHHYDIPALARDSTTPMTLRWLRALHRAGHHATLEALDSARYLANHWDVDILFSLHLADRALEPEILNAAGPAMAAAALFNDYLAPPPPEIEDAALNAFYAGLALEDALDRGEMTFSHAFERWLPALSLWLAGRAAPDDARNLRDWADAGRAEAAEVQERIHSWRDGMRFLADGALCFLEAPEKIDNSSLYLYLARHRPMTRLQLLTYPVGRDQVIYKIRSHGGLNINPLLNTLGERFPESRFGGRAAAGGSQAMKPETEVVLNVALEFLKPQGGNGGEPDIATP